MDGSASFDLVLADHLTLTAGTYNHPGRKGNTVNKTGNTNLDQNERGR
ncbi:hypothetical protein SDC9_97335 [bioreactor metagenome]|uniref:Uncharacterized protein n=1 Tax=bioreactor metagenome TaxID=1076179 RepID=A0A645AIB1_9ZZZZ